MVHPQNYKWQTDTLGSTFKVLGDYVYNNNNNNKTNGVFSSDYFDSDGAFLQNNTTANQLDQLSKIYAAKVDYQHNFKKGNSLQAGTKYSHSDIGNDAIEREKINGGFIINPLRTNNFTYTESIFAAYSNYSGNVKNIQYKIGLRMENSYIDGVSEDDSTSFDVHYFDLFPSAFLSWEFGKEKNNNALSLAVNRRISRPHFESLNPFEYVLNEFSISRGNTSLRPEYTKNLELNYSYLNTYSFGLFYSETDDIISKVLLANEDIAIYETQNISNQNSYGANVSLSFSPIKNVMQTYAYFALTNNEYTSSIVDESLATFSVRINNSFSFKDNINANVSFYYSTKELFGNRIYDPYGQADINISKSFFQKKLSVSLGLLDIFNFQNNNAVLIDSPEKIIVEEKYQSRKFQLYVFYNFNIGKSFKKKNIESSSSGEKSRLKG